MLTVNVKKVAQLARLAVPETDYILCILNTHGKFLGSANTGEIVRLSTSAGHQRSIVMHEFGHNFGPFVDEYVDGKQGGDRKPSPRLEGSVNATLESNVYLARWHHWNIPESLFAGTAKKKQRGKHFAFETNVQCVEGAATYFNDVYRAEENCHMQRGRGKQFCRVCTEGVEVRLMRFFAPIERVRPLGHVQRIGLNDALTLSVEPTAHAVGGDTIRVRWYRDGAPLGDRKVKVTAPKKGEPGGDRWDLTLKGSELKAGDHIITATVDFDSPRSHLDRGTQSSAYSWLVEVTDRGPTLKAPQQVSGVVGQPVAVHVERHTAGAPGAWTCVNPPSGADVRADGDKLSVSWTPTAAGRYRVEFEQRRDDFAARQAVTVQVKPAPPDLVFAHALRGVRFEQPKVSEWATGHVTAALAADAGSRLPMLLEQLPRTIWQHVDEPAKLAFWRTTVQSLLGLDAIDRKAKQALEALIGDLDLIDWYNTTRKSKPGPEAIRDKKYK